MNAFILTDYLGKLFNVQSIITIISLIAIGIIFIVIGRKTTFNTKTLSYAALSIAASFVLYYIKIFQLPNGGTITVAHMLPLFIFAYIAGPRAGIIAGLSYGFIHYIQEPFFVHPIQFLLDYPLAFGALGLAGISKSNYYIGAVVGSLGRFIFHFLSGVVFFGSYANGQNVFLYSFLYNGSYLLPDMIICLGILFIPNIHSAITRVRAQARTI